MTSHDVDAYFARLREFAAEPQGLDDESFKFQIYESRGHYLPFQGLDTRGILAWHRELLAALDRIEASIGDHGSVPGEAHQSIMCEIQDIRVVMLGQLWRDVEDIPGLLKNGNPAPQEPTRLVT